MSQEHPEQPGRVPVGELRALVADIEDKASDVDEMDRATDSANAHANGVSCGIRWTRDRLTDVISKYE